MGSKVTALRDGEWVNGTILGVHSGAYDILYEGGEGDMMKPSNEIRACDSEAGNVDIVEKVKKPSSIGWNAR